MTIEKEFINTIIAYGEQTESGNSSNTNKLFKKIVKIYLKLKIDKNELFLILIKYLFDSNEYISYHCATFLLEFNYPEAINRLESLAKGSGFCAFDTKMTLIEWRAGRLKFPPY
jgi:hypothetical protein